MKKAYKFFRGMTLMCFLFSMTTFSQTFTGGGGAIPDNGCASPSLFPASVSGLAASATIGEVLININHTYDADLDIYLVAPNGATLELSTDNGSFGDNYTNTRFSPTATASITTGSAPFTGTFLPEGNFSTVSGQTNGVWNLSVCDDDGLIVGNVINWSITFGAITPPPAVYCTSVPASNDALGISNLTLGTTNFVIPDVTYRDLTATPVSLQQGINVNTQITFRTGYTYDTNIWIDFNDNAVFEASELLFDGVSASSNPTTLNASFILPAGAPLGSHRLRIGTADTGQQPPNPCYNGNYGVTIDATIEIVAPICTSAELGTSVVRADCGNDRYYVDVTIVNANNAVSFSDGTNSFPVSGAGVNSVGPFASGSTVALTLVHTEAVCDIDLGSFNYTCPPANDLCGDAIDIGCGQTLSGSTTAATNDSTLGTCDTSLTSAPGVWYSLEGTGGDILVNTADSAFDTKLGVFTGSCSGLVCVGGNDDVDGANDRTSSVTFSSTMGQRYYIYVTGFSSASGNYNLTVQCICEVSFDDECNTAYSGYAPAASSQITATGQFGVAPYSYTLSDGQTNNTGVFTVTPSSTTTYEVTVTDATGCMSTAETTVVVVDVQCGNGGNQAKVIVCHNGDEICISPNAVQAHLNHGDSLGACSGTITCDTLPICDARLKVPGPGAIDVSIDIVLSWGAATGFVQGYLLSIGTTPGGTDVLNNFDVGNTLSYDPGGLINGTTYYVSVVPYNSNGIATSDCTESFFTTETSPWCNSATVACDTSVMGNTALNGVITDVPFCGTSLDTAPGIWYQFEGTGNAVKLTTCNPGTDYDTKIGVFTSSDCTTLTCVGGNDDQAGFPADPACVVTETGSTGNRASTFEFNSVAGTTYYVYVTGFTFSSGTPPDSGNVELSLTCLAPPPALQACVDAIGVSCNSTTTGSTTGYTSNPTLGTCTISLGSGPGRFYKLEGNGSSYNVNTFGSAFDTKLGVFSGNCGALVCVAGNDDSGGLQSSVTFTSQTGVVYYIYVTGFGSAAGNFTLNVSCAGGRVEEIPSTSSEWSLYPNPASNGEVQLDLTNYLNKDLGIQMMDFSGKLLINNSEQNLQNPRYTLKTQSMSNGLYFVRIVTESGASTKKLIIAN